MYLKLLFITVIAINSILSINPAYGDSQSMHSSLSQEKPEIRIGRLICGGHLSLAVAEKKYQQNLSSFRLKTVQCHGWKDVINDMISGEVAGTFMLSPLAMELIRLGFPGKIVLKADRNGNGFVLSDKIKSIADLNTRKSIIAVPHTYSQHHVLLYLILEQNNIQHKQVIVIGMKPREMVNSLRRGEIDGFVVGEPEANKSVFSGIGWMAAISPQIWRNHMDHVFIVTDRFISEQPVQLQELIDVLVRSGQFIESNPHEAAIMGEDYTGSSAEVFEQVLTSPPDWIDYSDMVPALDDIREMSANMVKMKLWKDMPSDMGIFINPVFVKQAVKSLDGTR